MKAFTRRSVLDGLESRKLPIVVMNMATVDDPGMIVCIVRIVSCRHWLQEGFPASSIYHIGVGSRVARSTTMGNARASVRRTSNSRSPTLFLCFSGNFGKKESLMGCFMQKGCLNCKVDPRGFRDIKDTVNVESLLFEGKRGAFGWPLPID